MPQGQVIIPSSVLQTVSSTDSITGADPDYLNFADAASQEISFSGDLNDSFVLGTSGMPGVTLDTPGWPFVSTSEFPLYYIASNTPDPDGITRDITPAAINYTLGGYVTIDIPPLNISQISDVQYTGFLVTGDFMAEVSGETPLAAEYDSLNYDGLNFAGGGLPPGTTDVAIISATSFFGPICVTPVDAPMAPLAYPGAPYYWYVRHRDSSNMTWPNYLGPPAPPVGDGYYLYEDPSEIYKDHWFTPTERGGSDAVPVETWETDYGATGTHSFNYGYQSAAPTAIADPIFANWLMLVQGSTQTLRVECLYGLGPRSPVYTDANSVTCTWQNWQIIFVVGLLNAPGGGGGQAAGSAMLLRDYTRRLFLFRDGVTVQSWKDPTSTATGLDTEQSATSYNVATGSVPSFNMQGSRQDGLFLGPQSVLTFACSRDHGQTWSAANVDQTMTYDWVTSAANGDRLIVLSHHSDDPMNPTRYPTDWYLFVGALQQDGTYTWTGPAEMNLNSLQGDPSGKITKRSPGKLKLRYDGTLWFAWLDANGYPHLIHGRAVPLNVTGDGIGDWESDTGPIAQSQPAADITLCWVHDRLVMVTDVIGDNAGATMQVGALQPDGTYNWSPPAMAGVLAGDVTDMETRDWDGVVEAAFSSGGILRGLGIPLSPTPNNVGTWQ